MLLLDTNVVIAVLTERPAPVALRLDAEIRRRVSIHLSTIVLFELRYGIAHSAQPGRNRALLDAFLTAPLSILPFEPEDADEAGEIRAHLRQQGTPIGPYDVLIAAQARRRGLTVVTANAREFARVPGLICEDWTR